MRWSPSIIETLKALWGEGLSASEIAARIGGVTRNAVIGKVHRLGLAARERRPARPGGNARRPNKRERPPMQPRAKDLPISVRMRADLPPLGPAPAAKVTIAEIRDGLCRWPEGDPRTRAFQFCGRPAQNLYCSHHAARAYRPATEPTDDDGGGLPAPRASGEVSPLVHIEPSHLAGLRAFREETP